MSESGHSYMRRQRWHSCELLDSMRLAGLAASVDAVIISDEVGSPDRIA